MGDSRKWHKYQYIHYFVIGEPTHTYYFHEEIWCLKCRKIIKQKISTQTPDRFDLDIGFGVYA